MTCIDCDFCSIRILVEDLNLFSEIFVLTDKLPKSVRDKRLEKSTQLGIIGGV